MARDYLQEASGIIFGDTVSLTELVESDPGQVIGNLLGILKKARGEMQAMDRKAAAYALGQIGEPKSLRYLREYYEKEPAEGVQEAMVASMTAIKLAPKPMHSQLERRQIIEDVYKGRREPDWL